MEKVLIVEDEILARIGLHQLLDWNGLGFSLLPDATDGQEALDSIEKNKPDILLLDLNIPKVNGLEILDYLKKTNSQCKVIVISCNEEFEMVKKAMKLGAYDYLRKLNLSKEELTGILEKCRNESECSYETFCKTDTFSFHEIRYEDIISGYDRTIFLNVGTYRTLLCVLPQAQNILPLLSDTVNQWFANHSLEYIQIIKSGQCCYYLFDRCLEPIFFSELHERLSREYNARIYIGIHESTMANNADVNNALILAEQITMVSYYDEETPLQWFSQKLSATGHSPAGIQPLLIQLKKFAEAFAKDDTLCTIESIFKIIIENKYTHINVLRRIFMDMLGVYSMTAQTLDGAIEEITVRNDNCHYQKLMMMNSLCAIKEWFIIFEETFHNHFIIKYKCSTSDILRRVFSYIDAHLTEQIHLSEAAKDAGISNAYLSTVFKKEMGQNFIEYVNIKKVSLAKQMLEEGKLVYEVSETLGFENCTYFSKVFKKYTGISPDSCRKKESIL